MMKMFISVLALVLMFFANAQDQFIGKWKTIDDESGDVKSVVEIYKQGDRYFGKIIKLFLKPGEDQDPVCTACEGDRNGTRIIGMEIISDFKYNRNSGELSKGQILDPENGNVYDCKIWVENEKLKVRGYLLFFYRTQTWLPYND